MKATLAVLFMVGMVSSALTSARQPAPSPLIGAWTVDVSRLPMPPAARPRGVTFTFTDNGSGRWTISVVIIDASGAERKSTVSGPIDGSAAPVQGDNMEADIAAIKMPQPDVMVIVLGKGGSPGSTRIYAVAPDSKSMIETATYFGKDGLPVMRTNYFTRAR